MKRRISIVAVVVSVIVMGFTIQTKAVYELGERIIPNSCKIKLNPEIPTTIKNIERYKEYVEKGLSEKEAELAVMYEEYREKLGSPKMKLSVSMTKVAREHTKDINSNHPELMKDNRGLQGNIHSWSISKRWKGGPYTEDHKYASMMWNKPRELTKYKGNGFEVSVQAVPVDGTPIQDLKYDLSPKEALEGWISSQGHHDVITNKAGWSKLKIYGVGIDGGFSCMWFGEEEDPEGYYITNN